MKVEMRFDVEEVACEYVLSFGPRVEVIEPQALRQRVVSAAEGVVAFYAKLAAESHPQPE